MIIAICISATLGCCFGFLLCAILTASHKSEERDNRK